MPEAIHLQCFLSMTTVNSGYKRSAGTSLISLLKPNSLMTDCRKVRSDILRTFYVVPYKRKSLISESLIFEVDCTLKKIVRKKINEVNGAFVERKQPCLTIKKKQEKSLGLEQPSLQTIATAKNL